MKSLKVALIGNPNSGKTTLFNALTGKHQEVGNWCGVTVDKKWGRFQSSETGVEVVDLPGCYHISPATQRAIDEQITTEYLASSKVDCIINVVDATHLERHLYLTLQLLEQGFPVIVALNMMDIAEKQNIHIDVAVFSQMLGCPIIPLAAAKNQGISTLKQAVLEYPSSSSTFPIFSASQSGEEIAGAKARYDFIQQILDSGLRRSTEVTPNWTERIDRIVLNRFLGIPCFLLLMYGVFVFTMQLGGIFQDFFEISSRLICVEGVSAWLAQREAPTWLINILAFGIGQGINTTLSFIPVIASMFFALSFLEASGYMARVAFVMDKIMQWAGLPGKSFVPMIIGFGCNVPAVLATRTLENYRERILTILMSPFMSCGARLAIYALFVSAFFPVGGQNVIFGLYLIGILIALLTGFILRTTLLPGERSALLIELPAYRWPDLGMLSKTTWQRLKRFILKAGMLIISLSVIIGALGGVGESKIGSPHHWFARIGKQLTPLFSPMGIKEDNWPATVGLVTGILAKEVVVGTLNALYLQQEPPVATITETFPIQASLKQAFRGITDNGSKLKGSASSSLTLGSEPTADKGVLGIMVKRFGSTSAAFAYLLFVLLYFPCISVVTTIAKELNYFWAIFTVVWTTSIAYMIAVLFYQVSSIAEHPIISLTWMMGIVLFGACGFYGLRRLMQYKQFTVSKKKLFPTNILILDV